MSPIRAHLKAQIESRWVAATKQGHLMLLDELAQALGSELEPELKRAGQSGLVNEPMLMALARCMSHV